MAVGDANRISLKAPSVRESMKDGDSVPAKLPFTNTKA
jgi:hypothetical protein